MNKHYPLITLLAFALLCCGTHLKLVVKQGVNDVEIEILYSDNCKSKNLYFDTISSIQFYTISYEFDFTNAAPYMFLTPTEAGKYFLDFHEGHYFYEIIKLDGAIAFSGLFTYPDDLTNGKLHLAQGRKKGVVQEKLEEGEYGLPIADAEIIHTNEITREEFIHFSDADGRICIELDAGRYTIEINHPDYFSYMPQKGFSVFRNHSSDFNEFFLERR